MARPLSKTTLTAGAITPDTHVIAYRGEERMSRTYRYAVTLAVPHTSPLHELLEEAVLGRDAKLVFEDAHEARTVHGIVTSVGGGKLLDDQHATVEVVIEPHLALLGLRSNSRIGMDKTALEAVIALLDEWGLAHRENLALPYDHRPYVTQHMETDLAFVERLLSSEGVAYYFDQSGDDGEVIILVDNPAGYGEARSKAVPFQGMVSAATEDEIHEFRLAKRLRSTAARLGDYDFRRPMLQIRALELVKQDGAASVSKRGTERFARYYHGDAPERARATELEADPAQARTVLEQLRSDRSVGWGSTHARWLAAGHTFALEGYPIASANRRYAVTSLVVEGKLPLNTGDAAETVTTEFEVVPDDVLLRPPFRPPPLKQVAETATVVGAGEEIWVDEHARVQVQFHWELDGKGADGNLAWLRVAQPWAGANWGVQFIPRVGMEVVVTFLGGDVDRPIITGCVYNGTHPPPFAVPRDKSISGLRTRSTPDAAGFNELSFEDKVGAERVYLHAEKDFDQDVQSRRTARIGDDDVTDVGASRKVTVAKDQTTSVGGDEKITVGKSRTIEVTESAQLSVGKGASLDVVGSASGRIEGELRQTVAKSLKLAVAEDMMMQTSGHIVMVAGEADKKGSIAAHADGSTTLSATGETTITSDAGLTIAVGETVLRMTPESLDIRAKSVTISGEKMVIDLTDQLLVYPEKKLFVKSEKVRMEAQGSKLELSQDVRLDGGMIKLNCKQDPVDPLEKQEPKKPAKMALTTSDGKKLAKTRFVVVMADGSERTGVTDAEGNAKMTIEDDAEIYFPDLPDVEE